MTTEFVRIRKRPKLKDARMVLGFSGWMDGGEVSIGTIEYLVSKLGARKLADIDPQEFYIYSFPGSMEISSLFRPHAKIEDGLITGYQGPTNTFFCRPEHNLVLFEGKEPHFHWKEYAECILSVASELNVAMMLFVGSVAGIVPHTKGPRIFCSVSDVDLMPFVEEYDLTPSNYEGPASFVTYLTRLSTERGLQMASLVAEIPAYVQGRNFKCIEAAARKLAAILDLPLDLEDLRAMSAEFVRRMNEAVQERPELAELIRKMEQDYDKEVQDVEMADLRAWFEKQDIRLD